MKKILIIVVLFSLASVCNADGNSDLTAIKKLTLLGYKDIRHDALISLRLRKVHEMNIAIRQLEKELK